jgi:predicted Zn finger-like uncharacterized protein
MKIVCPSCAATYEVPEAVVAAKRSVRCARCGNNWVPGSEKVAAESAPVADPAPPPPPPAPAPEPAVATVAAPAAPEPEPVAPMAAPTVAQLAEVAAPVAEPPPRPAPTVIRMPDTAKPARTAKPAVTAQVKPVRQTPVIGWVASIAALIIMASVSIVYRSAIMKSWPPSERVYAAVGLFHR